MSLNDKTTIRARCDLLADEQLIHPHRFAAQSLESDPVISPGIKIKGNDTYGQPFRVLLTSNGERKIMQMNTFVDTLIGRNRLEGTEKLPRRHVIRDNRVVKRRPILSTQRMTDSV